MSLIDKRGLLPNFNYRNPIILELGCGNRKRIPNAIGIDLIDYECVDIVGDAVEVLQGIPDATVDMILSRHFFEHVTNLEILLQEVIRVTRIGGRLEVVVPHFSNPYYYSDPTHKNYFGLYTFSYLAEDHLLRRRVPHYKTVSLSLIKVDLRFKSSPPFYFRYCVKRFFGSIFNSCRYMQEFYEENFCYIFPCYEIPDSVRVDT
ncbi:class I SAM-dependent methyltransferase [bacterium]|nr:class I SAM-dependent methyltransferase [bacterium]